jgi:hypothetical protein
MIKNQKLVLREARVVGNKDWPKWMPMGNVTYSEAARRMAMWFYNFDKKKKIPNKLKILVRDQGVNGIQFPFDVELRVDITVKALRGKHDNN